VTVDQAAPLTNPLLAPSPLPFELPPFALISDEHYAPAFDAAMAEHLAEIETIAGNPDIPTFDNTLVALERAGQSLNRVADVFFNLVSSVSTAAMRNVEAEYAPRFTAHLDAVLLDPRLFARIDAVHQGLDEADYAGEPLGEEQRTLVGRYHLDFVLAGARLAPADRARLSELNQRLAGLHATFNHRLLAAMEAAALVVDGPDELTGLSDDAIAAAATAAADRGHPGKYLLALILPTGQPALAALQRRDVRRRLHQASVTRALEGEHETLSLAMEIAATRAERAALMGFASHAELSVRDTTARTVEAVEALLGQLVEPAVSNARTEAAVMAEYAAADGVELQPWDWAYYSAQVQARKYAVDTAALRPYFALDRVLLDGVFHAAERVYGITFHPRTDLAGYHPDVRLWEVRNADGSVLGLYLGDYFAREGKRGGAWMSSFVDQSRLLDRKPVVFNNSNFNRAPEGQPTLLTLDEVRTLFHEFGHALHGLFSDVNYPRLSGTKVPRDFVEYPSQVNEMWALWPEILANYARHDDTGEPLPPATVDAIAAAELWGEGFRTTEYLGATLLDWAWHRLAAGVQVDDALAFEADSLDKAGLAYPLVPPRYRTSYFQHIFASGYAAGYYSYIWSEVLDAETVEWFKENGGLTRGNGDTFRRKLLSVGGSKDPMAAFRDLRGRDPDITPLLRRRGLDR
jgi:peptidyl-dipeptidase Dcp